MALGPFRLSLCFCLLFLASACFGKRLEERFNECQLERLNALEPDHRVESEGGITETWNSNHPELRCAGVTLLKRTIFPNSLHLPSYANYPQLIFIAQGRGAFGVSLPGCPVTHEEAESQSRQDRRRSTVRRGSQEQESDSHHKIYHFRQGHLIAIPAGVPYWSFNYGDEPVVAITLLDTANFDNQLDRSPRRFYLAGNPEEEHPEAQQEQQQQRRHRPQQPKRQPFGRRHGQREEEYGEEEEGNNLLSGFGAQFLAHAFGVDEEIVRRLQNPPEEKDQIVRVEGGFRDIISPRWGDEDEEEEREERQQQRQPPRRWDEQERGYDFDDEDDRRQSRRGQDEDDQRRPRPWWSRPGGQGREYDEEERRHERNGLEETECSPTLIENIARPSRADFYNPAAGRISSANSLTFPILGWFQLSAEHVLLYRNGIYSPHWNNNANSILYGIRGEGRIQVVNCEGNAVFNGVLREGQILLVPQNFAVAQQAGNEGFEYVAFKTNDRATISHIKQVIRGIPAEVLINAFGLKNHQVSALKYNGNQTPLVSARGSQYGPQRRD
ncbi:hypothetical protein PIB30_051082 [Stylosanthes scabra]|uniref:Cupin type-1 domain-containing protein n=1 Tax=Stylosanthes scabra TaxID=79078 RepID=A0ABU6YF80_9FABA|nr:hypothetical protein [Stylosanthes scabra]